MAERKGKRTRQYDYEAAGRRLADRTRAAQGLPQFIENEEALERGALLMVPPKLEAILEAQEARNEPPVEFDWRAVGERG